MSLCVGQAVEGVRIMEVVMIVIVEIAMIKMTVMMMT